jgi:hypothetical protein
LPQASVAVHVRVNTVDCGHVPGADVSTNVKEGLGSQASNTVGAAKDGVAGHSIVVFAGHVMAGATVSRTVIVWAQLA